MSDHPSVRNSNSAGAIGIMGVKKTVDGVWLHFAHNTDSFVSRVESRAFWTKIKLMIHRPWPRCIPTRRFLCWLCLAVKVCLTWQQFIQDAHRKPGNGSIATGGRAMKYRPPGWGRAHTDTWPANPDDTLDPGPSEQPAKRQKTKAEKPRRPSTG